jgi:tryptophan halogenase
MLLSPGQVIVLGGGTAGLMAALSLRRMLPRLHVRVIHSADIGVIGVGEGTTPLFPNYLLGTLGMDPVRLYAEAQPVWKLGLRMLWGPRPEYFYSFSHQFDARWSDLPKSNGYYCQDDYVPADIPSALMAAGKTASRGANGWPKFHPGYAFHIENERLVGYLTNRCREAGVAFTEGTVEQVERGTAGVAALLLDTGERITGDLFIDASGFRSELLERTLEEPFESFNDVLFCDRAVIGGWTRTTEPILPYTTAETMDAGWCWQIEHEHFINRGYVFSSRFISDDEARAELLRKNPKITSEPRLVKFRAGRHTRNWVGNVVAIGNADGFVEPLEATAISIMIYSIQALIEVLREGTPTVGMVATYNSLVADVWKETRDFLALHYRFNTRLDTKFWQHCRENTPLGSVQPLVDFYQDSGPSMLGRHLLGHHDNIFGLDGHLVMLIGQAVPHRSRHQPSPTEMQTWRHHIADISSQAAQGLTVAHALTCIRHPAWRWA